MKRYETYKDSGIQWVGEIPSHWEIVKLRYTGTFENGLTYSTGDIVEDDGILVLRSSNIQNEHITFDDCVYVNSVPKELMVSKGDIIICSRNGSAALIGKCAIIEDDVKASFGAFMMRYRANINNKYAFYLFLSAIANYRGLFSTSTINQLTMSIINQMQVALPSDTEQKNIAAFLDHKVGQIDATIAEKEQMLEDIKAYRSAIISEAVTKGLDKNVEMKDSGIEWCGYIPIHWQVLKIGYIFQNLDYLRQPISSENRERNNPQYEYYGASGVIDKIDSYNVNDKVLLIGEDGANLVSRTLPLIYKAEGKFWVNNHAHILKPISSDYDYMAFLLETADYTNYITGSAQPKLSQEKLSSVKLPVPPIEEQKQIAKKLICIVPLIDRSLIEIEKIIKDLKSYKSALITEAVTGKIDLRDWKPKEEKV